MILTCCSVQYDKSTSVQSKLVRIASLGFVQNVCGGLITRTWKIFFVLPVLIHTCTLIKILMFGLQLSFNVIGLSKDTVYSLQNGVFSANIVFFIARFFTAMLN